MNKVDLVKSVAEECSLSQSKAADVVESVFEHVMSSIEEEGSFSWRGFGVFSLKKRKEKKGRNPKTGEEILIPEMNTVSFKVSKSYRDSLNEK